MLILLCGNYYERATCAFISNRRAHSLQRRGAASVTAGNYGSLRTDDHVKKEILFYHPLCGFLTRIVDEENVASLLSLSEQEKNLRCIATSHEIFNTNNFNHSNFFRASITVLPLFSARNLSITTKLKAKSEKKVGNLDRKKVEWKALFVISGVIPDESDWRAFRDVHFASRMT